MAAAHLCFARLMCLLFRVLPAAATTRFLASLTACFALVCPLVAKIPARVTVAALLSAPPRFFLVLCLGVMAVLVLASLVSTLASALFHLLSLATHKNVLDSKMKIIIA